MPPDSDALDRPNIVYVHTHDLGQHLGCYGHGVHTPNLDAIADDGVRFDRYFAAAPTCSPSRASAATGCYPHRNGMMGLSHRGWRLNDDMRAFPERLADEGYETHFFGIYHSSKSPDRLGYTDDHGYGGRSVEWERAPDTVDDFEEWLDGRSGDDPFLATVGFDEPHSPFRRDHVPDDAPDPSSDGWAPPHEYWNYVPSEAYDRYDPDEVELPPFLNDTPEVREKYANFCGLVTGAVDPAVGRIADAIDRADEDVLLIFGTDHGISFRGAKGTPRDSGLQTALLMQHPDLESSVEDALLSNVDFMPTLVDLAGGEPPTDVDGRSFAPLLRGESYEPRERIFAESTWHGGQLTPFRLIRTDRHKYVEHYASRTFDSDDANSNHRGFPLQELFDLDADPYEEENLAGDRERQREPPVQFDLEWREGPDPDLEHAELLGSLCEDLHEWMVATGDPIADGMIPMSATDRKNATECR